MIVLMRHGKTVGGEGCCIGRTDVSLSEEGREQARRVADMLGEAGFVRLCTSPSRRAKDTLAPLAARCGLAPEVLPGLDEIDMGEWDGMSFADIQARHPEEYARRGLNFADFRSPGGESFRQVADRAMEELKRLAAGPQPVLVVTHAGVIRSVLCRLLNQPLNDQFRHTVKHTQLTVLESENGGLRVVSTGIFPCEFNRGQPAL